MSVQWTHKWMDEDGVTNSSLAMGPATSGKPTFRLMVGDRETYLSLDELDDLLYAGSRMLRRATAAVKQLEDDPRP